MKKILPHGQKLYIESNLSLSHYLGPKSLYYLLCDFYHEIVANTADIVVAGTDFVGTRTVGHGSVILHQVRVVIIG